MKTLGTVVLLALLFVFAIGLAEVGCTFHNPDSSLYIGKISYRCG